MIDKNLKCCILYGGYAITKTSLWHFKRIAANMPDYYDIFWMTDPGLAMEEGVDKEYLSRVNFIYYKTKDIYKYGYYNINQIIEKTYESLKKEGYFYFYYIEYDVCYTGSYKELFPELDGKCEADYLGSFFKLMPFAYGCWDELDVYLDNLTKVDLDMKYCVGSHSPFFRISAQALNFIYKYKFSDIRNFHYDLVYPTLLHNYDFKLEDYAYGKTNRQFDSEYTLTYGEINNMDKSDIYLSWNFIKNKVKMLNNHKLFFHPMKMNLDLYKKHI